ncbi:baseplate J/gp47 family protein [Sideroxydans lithotrophicus]|uniref:Baseplate J family protein n=1 Tax=Sideroxydans lithotrophicus (strain ES-1) TaxID=580332 RepID=D5CT41_SIDLE|nr:baseplate J/gp47 family protein [Sideroxydans lithotrophicus]ADE12127.1 Baseplate J family protein [Sideroxydans lithotrophicus ES-1]
MATLNTKTFNQLVSDQVAAIQSRVQQLIDFAIGSILRSIVESNATVSLWFQGLLLQILAITRAATSTGTDLDSWAADYAFYRLAATYATGQVTFSRFNSTFAAFIPVGTQIQTSDSSPEVFAVTVDTTNPNYSATLNGYNVPALTVSISVPVQCTTLGSVGNVLAGLCKQLTGSIPGIDTVTNANPFVNGLDAETDTAFRARFVSYIGSLSKATRNAIANAISSVQQGLTFTLTENFNYAGAAQPGYFYTVVDDGSGNPPSALLTSINNAIDAVRAFTVTFGVYGPVLETATIALTVTSTNHAADAVLVQAAIAAYIATLGIGASLPYTKLAQLAYDASPTITNVTSVTLNSGTADLAASAKQRIIAGTITVS